MAGRHLSTHLKLKLYSAPLSGCSARIRIAAQLKKIPSLTYHNVSLEKSEQHDADYLRVNPNASVPSLVITDTDTTTLTITQSGAILDFLETRFPTPALLPRGEHDVGKRARVLELVNLVACDIQPPQGSKVRARVAAEGGDAEEWARWVYNRGFGVYERFLERDERHGVGAGVGVGLFSVGDDVTLADCYLFPAVQGAARVGIDIRKWPRIRGVVAACWEVEEFRRGGLWREGGEGIVPISVL